MKIISLLICLTVADMASYNRYANSLVKDGMGQERSEEKAESNPLPEYKLKLL